MQTKDHLTLGHFLVEKSTDRELKKHQKAFLLGCVEPDYNVATYLRGFVGYQKFRGHNAENALAHIQKCLAHFCLNEIHTPWDYFTLGTVIHYAADSFTWPHNEFWRGSLAAHLAYEAKLHEQFACVIGRKTPMYLSMDAKSLSAFFCTAHRAYAAAPHSMDTDCQYIVGICETVLLDCLQSSEINKFNSKEGTFYENPYHHGLVSASH